MSIILWMVFCLFGIPVLVYLWDMARRPHREKLADKLDQDEYNPAWMMEALEHDITTERVAGYLWLIGGFGTFIWFFVCIPHFALARKFEEDFCEYREEWLYTRRKHFPIHASFGGACTMKEYCPYCSGEWHDKN